MDADYRQQVGLYEVGTLNYHIEVCLIHIMFKATGSRLKFGPQSFMVGDNGALLRTFIIDILVAQPQKYTDMAEQSRCTAQAETESVSH